jgi:pimeloyl-ACP methyl ester carboxylesterase
MPTLTSYDGATLAYRVAGNGEPLVCLPGGPGRSADYLGELGGLSRHRRLFLLDLRGTGGSEVPDDRGTLRVDRLVDDVDALREHLGQDRLDLLAHSAAANLAVLYAARHPDRIRRLVLVTPGTHALGLAPTPDELLAAARRRAGEVWFPAAYEAVEALLAGDDGPTIRSAFAPLNYGRFDAVAATHAEATARQTAAVAAEHFFPPAGFDVEAVRRDAGALAAPVLVHAGELDIMPTAEQAADIAACFPRARVEVQPSAGHHPWLDDPQWFGRSVEAFLAS